jgi:hyperosmotically inducible protein
MGTNRRLVSLAVACGLALSLLPACSPKLSHAPADDLTITTRVKTALLNDPDITAPRIDVETVKGIVTLSGRVASKQEEQRAIDVARKVPGVADVKSTLQIQPEATGSRQPATSTLRAGSGFGGYRG